jgi:hypothetical protein
MAKAITGSVEVKGAIVYVLRQVAGLTTRQLYHQKEIPLTDNTIHLVSPDTTRVSLVG